MLKRSSFSSTDYGADASLCDADGRNALHKAAEGGKKDAIIVLLDSKNSLSSTPQSRHLMEAKDVRGRTAVDLLPTHCQRLKELFVEPS